MAAAMSDFDQNRMEPDNSGPTGQAENIRNDADTKSDKSKVDFSNGFENSHRPYVADERLLAGLQAPSLPQQHPQGKDHVEGRITGPGGYLTSTLRQSMIGEERHSLSAQHAQQQTDGVLGDTIPYILQTPTQTLIAQPQGQMVQDYSDHSHLPQQIRQFDGSQVSQQMHSYGDQARYITRDPSCRESGLYAHVQPSRNPVFSATGGYVTVQHPQLPPQSVSPQPPFYSSIIMPTQTLPVTQDYTQFSGLPQYSYGQIPKNLINPIPYNAHMGIYPGQQFRPPLGPNQQRFTLDIGQYQGQPIIQPISQNVIGGGADRGNSARGPKPMVPPRGNSKITHDAGHRKSASTDITAGKLENLMMKCEITNQKCGNAKEDSAIPSSVITNPTSGAERIFATPLNQTPRTRQDGLYVDTSTNQITKNKPMDSSVPECDLYVSCSEHRKSMSVDVSTSFQKRNDTITFTFPGESKHSQEMKKSITGDKQWGDNQLCVDHQRRMEPMIRVSPIGADVQQDTSYVQTAPEQKTEWGGVSPSARSIVVSHENRRSEHFDDRRSSPMPTDPKHSDDIRSSPMSFMAIRDSLNDRINQKTPVLSAQNFEKTKQELANWAEERQRQDIEKQMYQEQVFSTSPKPKNKPEYHRDLRASYIGEEHRIRDHRGLQTAFQPIPNISPNTIMEQRRHLRHVSADLTKQMELTRKEFDDQSTTGSITNLIPIVNTASSQRNSPNICHQFPALSDATFDTKMALTIVTDFDSSAKAFKQTDHIIHGHKKSHNVSTNLLTHSKSHVENLQMVSLDGQSDEKSVNQHQQHQQKFQQNQQSLDIISEKLSQFERQQNDLQQRLQCLQNQNKILDQVAQFQHMQSDLHTRLQCLQERQATEKTLRHATDFQQKKVLTTLPEHLFTSLPENETKHQQLPANAYLPTINFQTYTCHSTSSNKLSPRMSDNVEPERNSQIGLSEVLKYEKSEGPRISLSYPATYQTPPVVTAPTMISDNMVISSAGSQALPSSIISTKMMTESVSPGTFKKVPPEKPPRTSRIAQSPDVENLSQTSGGNARGPGFSSSANICSSTTSMVNGANLESQDIRDNVGDREHALVYRDGNLVSGSLEALVQHMVPTEEYYPDRAYLFAFLLSSRLFIKPHELLSEVCALCEHQQKLGGEGGKERLQRFVPRLVQLLAEWTETFPYDFRDERVMAHVKSITQKVASVDATARQEVSALLQNLLLRLTALERYEEGLARLATESGAQQLSQVDVTELCPSATILAQQLTHVELERLSYIGPEEFVQAFAKESPHLETSFKEMKKTRNLESYVQWFNRLSYFVATEICKHAKKKQRVRVVEYWIETARECFNIGNFNSLMAIIAGLNMSSISRLKKTWSKVQSAKFAILEHQMDPSSNFSSYRSTLKAAMWRSVGATDERQRIVVPFFSLLVKDLYFLNEGCSNKLPNGHINFEKFWQLAKQVTEFIAWKQVTCPFEKNSRVIAFLQASPVLTENALSLASFECEPPDSNPEKERFKSLKSELNAQ